MTTCPKCQYTRKPSDDTPDYECPGCGVIYHKFIQRQESGWNKRLKNNYPATQGLASSHWSAQARINCVIVMITFAFVSLFFVRESYYGLQIENWSKTTGVILSSYVSTGGRSGKTARISYQYFVNGKGYQNDRISFGMLSLQGKNTDPQAVVNYYYNGKQATVYYNQNDPGNSVLERQTNYLGNVMFLFVTITVFVITSYYRFFKKAG